MMKRIFDLIGAMFLLILFSVPMLIIALVIRCTSKGPALHISDRVGIDNLIFRMFKFRTMRADTPAVATHLLADPAVYVTPVGSFLRRFSLDELPQLFNIISGTMTFVGPRPALFNQDDLIKLRTEKNIHKLVPGVTGWAQVNGRDSLPIPVKVEFDEYYLKNRSPALDIRIMLMTVIKAMRGEGIQH